mmetsp:Transcript_19592/g.32885  ORF Transcript_19592/g.32885 Transcript_19592/m.32885 type:complete len:416 (-) Transcript_19592:458-1705(-)
MQRGHHCLQGLLRSHFCDFQVSTIELIKEDPCRAGLQRAELRVRQQLPRTRLAQQRAATLEAREGANLLEDAQGFLGRFLCFQGILPAKLDARQSAERGALAHSALCGLEARRGRNGGIRGTLKVLLGAECIGISQVRSSLARLVAHTVQQGLRIARCAQPRHVLFEHLRRQQLLQPFTTAAQGQNVRAAAREVLQLLHHPPCRHRLLAQCVRPRQHQRGGCQGPPRQERRARLGGNFERFFRRAHALSRVLRQLQPGEFKQSPGFSHGVLEVPADLQHSPGVVQRVRRAVAGQGTEHRGKERPRLTAHVLRVHGEFHGITGRSTGWSDLSQHGVAEGDHGTSCHLAQRVLEGSEVHQQFLAAAQSLTGKVLVVQLRLRQAAQSLHLHQIALRCQVQCCLCLGTVRLHEACQAHG